MKTKNNKNGFVLITVLLLVVLLTALLLPFFSLSQQHLLSTNAFHQKTQALYIARSALQLTLAVIDNNPDFQANLTLRQMLQAPTTHTIASHPCQILLQSENGKININHLNSSSSKPDRPRIDQLLLLIDNLNQTYRRSDPSSQISYAVVPAMIDWTDPDSQTTILHFVRQNNSGAEANEYHAAHLTWTPTNQPFNCLEEMLLVKGISTSTLYGTEKTNSTTLCSATSAAASCLADHITIYGDGKIDINTATSQVLQTLSPDISPALAHRIIGHRRLQPFTNIAELKNLPGLNSKITLAASDLITTDPKTRYYTVTCKATLRNANTTLTAVIRKSASQNAEIILYRQQ